MAAAAISLLSTNSRYLAVGSVVAALWLVLETGVLDWSARQSIAQAAKLQEEFDCRLFAIPWNPSLVGAPVSLEVEQSLANSLSSRLRIDANDWYPRRGSLPSGAHALLCQRASAVWETRERFLYAWVLTTMLVALLLGGVAVGWLVGASLQQYVLAVMIPCLPAALHAIEEFRVNHRARAARLRIQEQIRVAWATGIEPSLADLRAIQDAVFVARSQSVPVPLLLNLAVTSKYRREMLQVADSMEREWTDQPGRTTLSVSPAD